MESQSQSTASSYIAPSQIQIARSGHRSKLTNRHSACSSARGPLATSITTPPSISSPICISPQLISTRSRPRPIGPPAQSSLADPAANTLRRFGRVTPAPNPSALRDSSRSHPHTSTLHEAPTRRRRPPPPCPSSHRRPRTPPYNQPISSASTPHIGMRRNSNHPGRIIPRVTARPTCGAHRVARACRPPSHSHVAPPSAIRAKP